MVKDVLRRRGEPIFYTFDLLWLNGQDLRGLPLLERKNRLRRLLVARRLERVLYADHIEERSVEFYRAVCRRDCKGIVAKRKDGIYSARGRTRIKIKNPNYSQGEGRREMFESLRKGFRGAVALKEV
jgi:bifunctional non-homologous end joining protein LigD